VVILSTAEQLFAFHVTGLEGFDIGEIKDFEVNPSTWEITHLVIALSESALKELRLKKLILTPRMCVPISAIDSSEGKFSLNKPLRKLFEGSPEILECPREAFGGLL
jgi:hypothetical protein